MKAIDDHISDETLELFVLGRLPGQRARGSGDPELEHTEEHLLSGCSICLKAAEKMAHDIEELRRFLPIVSMFAKEQVKGSPLNRAGRVSA